jgi:hypothetical protein
MIAAGVRDDQAFWSPAKGAEHVRVFRGSPGSGIMNRVTWLTISFTKLVCSVMEAAHSPARKPSAGAVPGR